MYVSREEREELKTLSKEIFGKSSTYQKYLNGVSELVTRTITETVPGKDGEEPKTVEKKVPVLFGEKTRQYKTRYYTVTEVLEMLRDMKKQLDDYREKMKKLQEEQQAKQKQAELEKQIQKDTAGSAV